MECPKCQHQNADSANFCNECATPLPLICLQCGHTNSPGSKFCNECARDLSQAVVTESPPSTSASSAPTGERRQATVLFSDLSGFTAMTEKLDPEEVQGLMRRLKDRAVEIVEAH
ncbi:MAG: zinc ribbon domain-containing protein, partial [SAR324 cluster bacterium]|nr:zinc ribbon domain-containing protein [SAR324 cluster bacterium]